MGPPGNLIASSPGGDTAGVSGPWYDSTAGYYGRSGFRGSFCPRRAGFVPLFGESVDAAIHQEGGADTRPVLGPAARMGRRRGSEDSGIPQIDDQRADDHFGWSRLSETHDQGTVLAGMTLAGVDRTVPDTTEFMTEDHGVMEELVTHLTHGLDDAPLPLRPDSSPEAAALMLS